MSLKPPTRIRVSGNIDYPVGKYLVAKLCELGYDIVLSESYKYLPPYDKFYNVTFDRHNLHEFAHFTFHVWNANQIETDELLLIRKSEINIDDFVNFFVYCWGMNRGGRLPYDKHMEVTQDKIREWKLRDLV